MDEVIDLKDVYRVQLRSGTLLEPYDFSYLVEWCCIDTECVVAFWKVKGHSILLMLNQAVPIPQKKINEPVNHL